MKFSHTLQNILNERQLKQADLCRMTGIQTSLMSDYLNDKKSPAITNAILIADALNISLDTLVGKTSNTTPPPQTTKIMSELSRQMADLSEEELLFFLDCIKAFKNHLPPKKD